MAGRPVKIRASYVSDAQYLTRIARAVELDRTRPPAWRKTVLNHLEELVSLFMHARDESAEAPSKDGAA